MAKNWFFKLSYWIIEIEKMVLWVIKLMNVIWTLIVPKRRHAPINRKRPSITRQLEIMATFQHPPIWFGSNPNKINYNCNNWKIGSDSCTQSYHNPISPPLYPKSLYRISRHTTPHQQKKSAFSLPECSSSLFLLGMLPLESAWGIPKIPLIL